MTPVLSSLQQPSEYSNLTVVSGTALRSNPMYVTYYIFWSKFIFVEVIPYFTILVLNSLIIGKIWKSTKFRKRFVVRLCSLFRLSYILCKLHMTFHKCMIYAFTLLICQFIKSPYVKCNLHTV